MAILVTEGWSGVALRRSGKDGWSARRTFLVSGASSAAQASLAPGIPPIGEAHPDNSLLFVSDVDMPRPAGFGLFEVIVTYAMGAVGNDNPLFQPPRVQWTRGNLTEQADRDAFGNAVLNTAGDATAAGPPKNWPTRFLRITINMPFFDLQRSMQYEDTLNSDNFSIKAAGGVEPGQCLCVSIQPAGEFTVNNAGNPSAGYVPVAHDFELRRGTKKLANGLWNGFFLRFLDQGRRSYYTDKAGVVRGPALIFDPNGEAVGSDTPLNGQGKALGADFKVGTLKLAPANNPNAIPGAIIDSQANGTAYVMYQMNRVAAFGQLGV